MRQNLYVKILAKMDARLKTAFGESARIRLAPKTLIDLAKQFGYLEGVRGPSGGYLATDKGVEYLGLNVDEFVAKETKQKIVDGDEVKRRQREASILRANELADLMVKAQKEYLAEQPATLEAAANKRKEKYA